MCMWVAWDLVLPISKVLYCEYITTSCYFGKYPKALLFNQLMISVTTINHIVVAHFCLTLNQQLP